MVEVACGHSHTIARTSEGKVYTWGRGDSGELGHGNMTDRSVPTALAAVEGHTWVQVAAGSYYSAGIADTGSASYKSVPEVLETFTQRHQAMANEEVRELML